MSFVFTHSNHIANLDSATLTLFQDQVYWEKDILQDLASDWKTIEYLLPSFDPEGSSWKRTGFPTKIKYILFKFNSKSAPLTGSFEIRNAHLIRAMQKTRA